MKVLPGFALAAGLGLFTHTATAAMDDVNIKAIKATDNLYMLTGRGGNMGVFIGSDGTFLIDDQFAPLTGKIITAIKELGGKTPDFVINTHYHGDHTGGNENVGERGALIVSHDNVRHQLMAGSFISAFKSKRAPLTGAGLPTVTFAEDISFHLNGDTVHAFHTPHAHTDGDAVIHFKKANVIHAGDLFFNGFFPFIDTEHGGSLRGTIKAIDRILALSDGDTKIIPGHGPLANKADLQGYRAMLAMAYERLMKLKASGLDAKGAVEQQPLKDLEAEWGDGSFTADRWIEVVYPGVY